MRARLSKKKLSMIVFVRLISSSNTAKFRRNKKPIVAGMKTLCMNKEKKMVFTAKVKPNLD